MKGVVYGPTQETTYDDLDEIIIPSIKKLGNVFNQR